MSVRTKLEGWALLLALVAVAAFVVSAAAGVRLHGSASPPDSATLASPTDSGAASVRVEVLNGSGKSGLARVATERLRAAGYDVVYFGNYSEPRGISVAIDRGGRERAADAVAARLGITTVRAQPDASRLVDVTVLLGKDWPPAPPPRPESKASRTWKAIKSVF